MRILTHIQNYLIGSHPHGIISMAAFVNFATDGTGILEMFPKIEFHLCTLVGQFYTPIRREWGLLHGMIDCSRESLTYILNAKKVNFGQTLPFFPFLMLNILGKSLRTGSWWS